MPLQLTQRALLRSWGIKALSRIIRKKAESGARSAVYPLNEADIVSVR
jgi:hypothetical protein